MTDFKIVNRIVLILGAIGIIGMLLLGWLIHGKTPGAELAIIAGPMGVAIGQLGSMLNSTRTTGGSDNEPIQVEAPPGQPMQVEQVADDILPAKPKK